MKNHEKSTFNVKDDNIFTDQMKMDDDEYTRDHRANETNEENFMRLFWRRPSKILHDLLSQAMDETLIERVIGMIDKYEQKKDEMACLKMLICTISPIVQGMQASLKRYIKLQQGGQQNSMPTGSSSSSTEQQLNVDSAIFSFKDFFTYLPTRQQYLEKAAECERIYAKACAKYFSFVI